ncbi:MAG: DUF2203 domain-containing protein [Acidimicrobiales bacterium]
MTQYWTEDEARAYLPRLRLLLGVIRRASNLAVHARANGHAAMPGASPAPGLPPEADDVGAEAGDELPVTFDAADALEELESKGIVLRDPERGLIDFPARHGGREVLLCWQLGEDDLGWWHLPEDGFAGRRPLPLPPEL